MCPDSTTSLRDRHTYGWLPREFESRRPREAQRPPPEQAAETHEPETHEKDEQPAAVSAFDARGTQDSAQWRQQRHHPTAMQSADADARQSSPQRHDLPALQDSPHPNRRSPLFGMPARTAPTES